MSAAAVISITPVSVERIDPLRTTDLCCSGVLSADWYERVKPVSEYEVCGLSACAWYMPAVEAVIVCMLVSSSEGSCLYAPAS